MFQNTDNGRGNINNLQAGPGQPALSPPATVVPTSPGQRTGPAGDGDDGVRFTHLRQDWQAGAFCILSSPVTPTTMPHHASPYHINALISLYIHGYSTGSIVSLIPPSPLCSLLVHVEVTYEHTSSFEPQDTTAGCVYHKDTSCSEHCQYFVNIVSPSPLPHKKGLGGK